MEDGRRKLLPASSSRLQASALPLPPSAFRLPSFVFVSGKGGVGKTTCAAAFAIEAARTRRTLLVSTDPASSLGDVLGMRVGWTPRSVRGVPRLAAVDLDATRQRRAAPGQLRGGDPAGAGARPHGRLRLAVLHRRPPRAHGHARGRRHRRVDALGGRDLDRGGPRSRAHGLLQAVRRARDLRADLDPVLRHRQGPDEPGARLQGRPGPQRRGRRGPGRRGQPRSLRLPGAHGGGHPDHGVRPRARRSRPAPARRDRRRRRGQLQPPLRPGLPAAHPRGGGAAGDDGHDAARVSTAAR